MRRKTAMTAAAVAAAGALLAGCEHLAWWGAKKAAKQEATELGEKSGVIKSKEDLKEEIAELKKKAEREREECRTKEDELKRNVRELREENDRMAGELKKLREGK